MERVGLYPGTFDPITKGHLDIIGRGLKLVGRLIIGVAVNEEKKPLFSLAERTEIVERDVAELPNPRNVRIEVKPFDNLLPCSYDEYRT